MWTRFNKKAGVGLRWSKEGDSAPIYQVPEDASAFNAKPHEAGSTVPGIAFSESSSDLGLGIETGMHFASVRPEDEGIYRCENQVSASEAKVLLKVDCQWSAWGAWSACSRDCVEEGAGQLGKATRTRKPAPPKNGGLECDPKDATQERNCPYKIEANPESGVKFCPGIYVHI